MRKSYPALIVAAAALTASCSATDDSPEASASESSSGTVIATSTLQSADGSPRGSVTIDADDGIVELTVNATGLPPGQHGTHLHTVGSCVAPDFKSAGGHLNPFEKQHGTDNPQGSHLGDLPNLTVDEDGTGSLTVTLPGTPEELTPILFDDDGTAVVIHEVADDNRSDPAGNAGPRLACGVLTQP